MSDLRKHISNQAICHGQADVVSGVAVSSAFLLRTLVLLFSSPRLSSTEQVSRRLRPLLSMARSRRASKSWIYEREVFKCKEIHPKNGGSCGATFTQLGSLKRHIVAQHQIISTTFVLCLPGSKPQRTRHRAPANTGPTTEPATVCPRRPSSPLHRLYTQTRLPKVQDPTPALLAQLPLPRFTAPFYELNTTRSAACAGRDAAPPPLRPPPPQATPAADIESREVTCNTLPRSTRECPSPLSMTSAGSSPKGLMESLPAYEVKRSTKADELKGLGWLSASAKSTFDRFYERLLASWGVSSQHKGTCILCPEAWRRSDPLDLMALFSKENYPSPTTTRAFYSHLAYGTTLARAAAWFNTWPRTGVELDNFIGCGPYKPMDASHLCHHDHCIIHLTYEPTNINQDRKDCRRRAQFLRQQKRDVPEHCTQHDPPCMLQVRSLCFTSLCTAC